MDSFLFYRDVLIGRILCCHVYAGPLLSRDDYDLHLKLGWRTWQLDGKEEFHEDVCYLLFYLS
jgi:hypothetical protein